MLVRFISVHQELVIGDCKFRKGMYQTSNPKEISMLSNPYVANRYQVVKLDPTPEEEVEEVEEEKKEAIKKANAKSVALKSSSKK